MAGPVRSRALNGPSRAALLRKDHQGVASTIGTIMALLVFLAFMAMIVNSYVPAWMLDNEHAHMNETMDQFGEMKGKVDSMITQQMVAGDSSLKMYAPITMGSDGVPLFATSTASLLTYSPQGSDASSIKVQFNYTAGTAIIPVNIDGGGKAELYAPNRYYVQQWIAYENGAIILKQEDGQSVRGAPNLDITKNNKTLDIEFTQVDMIGSTQSMTGADTVGFSIDLVYVDSQNYNISAEGGTFSLRFNTTYGEAWYKYLSQYCESQGLTNNTDYVLTEPVSAGSTDGLTTFTLTLKHCNTLQYNRAYVDMSLMTS